MNTLTQHFDRLHPLHILLHKLTILEPEARDQAEFFDELIRLANKADATTLSAERILLALMTIKCPNKDLRTKLLRKPTTLIEAAAKAKEYVSAQRMDTGDRVSAASQQRQKPQRCYRCRGNHQEQTCWTLKKRCPNCGITGHAKRVCKKGNTKKPEQQGNKQTRKANSASAANSTHHGPVPNIEL